MGHTGKKIKVLSGPTSFWRFLGKNLFSFPFQFLQAPHIPSSQSPLQTAMMALVLLTSQHPDLLFCLPLPLLRTLLQGCIQVIQHNLPIRQLLRNLNSICNLNSHFPRTLGGRGGVFLPILHDKLQFLRPSLLRSQNIVMLF